MRDKKRTIFTLLQKTFGKGETLTMEKLFQLKKHNTNVRTEVIGGLTTFFAMAYIIFVNPNFLSQTGMDHTAVMLATCVSAAIGCFLTAFMANVPFAQAPGMGLNAFFTYTMCDCFDTVGTLIGTAGSAGMLDENGNLPRGDKALIADAVATCTGALMGTSTVTTFVESSTGISEGARTGLSSVVVGILFLLGCVLAPIAGIIPSAATAPR